MLIFNKAISALALVKIPLTGKKKYIRTNKQDSPLLERLDWFLPLFLGPHLTFKP